MINPIRVVEVTGTVAASAALTLAAFAGTGILPGTGSVAAAARVAPSEATSGHRVACALTEDSRLTTCGQHRIPLDYRHGGWFAPGSGIPSWLHFGHPTWIRMDGRRVPCVIVYGKPKPGQRDHGTSAEVCQNGIVYGS
jgi:hypothetical protein